LSKFCQVDGARLYFDADGVGLVADAPTMRQKPTLVFLDGGPGFDHACSSRISRPSPTPRRRSTATTATMVIAGRMRRDDRGLAPPRLVPLERIQGCGHVPWLDAQERTFRVLG